MAPPAKGEDPFEWSTMNNTLLDPGAGSLKRAFRKLYSGTPPMITAKWNWPGKRACYWIFWSVPTRCPKIGSVAFVTTYLAYSSKHA